MNTLYILRLKEGKYYIGKTNNAYERIYKHNIGKGSSWIKKYPIIEIESIIHNTTNSDGDRYVEKYMDKYGIDSVRGGNFCQLVISNEIRKQILEKIEERKNKEVNDLKQQILKTCSSNIKLKKTGLAEVKAPVEERRDSIDYDILVEENTDEKSESMLDSSYILSYFKTIKNYFI